MCIQPGAIGLYITQTQKRDTPRVIEWLKEDDVDVVVMVPL